MKVVIRALLFIVVVLTPNLILPDVPQPSQHSQVTAPSKTAMRGKPPVDYITVGTQTDSKKVSAKKPAKNILALVFLNLARSKI